MSNDHQCLSDIPAALYIQAPLSGQELQQLTSQRGNDGARNKGAKMWQKFRTKSSSFVPEPSPWCGRHSVALFFLPWGTFYAQLIWPLVMWNADASWVKLHSMSTKFGCANTWRVVTVLVPLGNVPVATRNLFQNSHLPKASNLYRCSYHKNGKAGSYQNLCNSPRAFFQLLLCLCRCGRQAFQQPRLLAFCEVGLGWDPAHGSLCTAIALLGLHH